jgi:hypothetical protein
MTIMGQNELLRYAFGEFGNYGSALVVKVEDELLSLKMENWAYGETNASISTTAINASDLIELGLQLVELGRTRKAEEEDDENEDELA